MLISNFNDWEEKGHVGDWSFRTEKKTGQLNIWIRYPENDPRLGDLPIEEQSGGVVRIPLNQPEGVREKPWEWDGIREAPTIKPSILIKTADCILWHGFMTQGKLITV